MSSLVNCTVAMTLLFAQEVAFFKKFAGNVLFRAIIRLGKKNTFRRISPKFPSEKKKNALFNNSDPTCFSDTLTTAWPLCGCWNHRMSGSGFNTSLGAQQMLMHRKSCLIPIFKSLSIIFLGIEIFGQCGLSNNHSLFVLRKNTAFHW